ncbi:MAG TPA: hypothetical protein V6D13_01035 [Halomicronema sp.]
MKKYTCEDALLLAIPAFTKEALVLRLEEHPDLPLILEALLAGASTLAESAAATKRQWCQIFLPGDSEPYEIPAAWAKKNRPSPKKAIKIPSSAINPQTFERISSAVYGPSHPVINKDLLHILERMVETERPMSLVRMNDDRQLWINAPMADLLQTEPSLATKRVMTDFWLPGELEYIKIELAQTNSFYHSYQGGLNSSVWAKLEAQFEIVEASGTQFRLVTNFYAEPTKRPIFAVK